MPTVIKLSFARIFGLILKVAMSIHPANYCVKGG